MKQFSITVIFLLSFYGVCTKAIAVEPKPAIILNFAQMNELDWAAPEEKWLNEIKPKVVKEITQMRSTLEGFPEKTPSRRLYQDDEVVLAWSTLMEYMNFPMDTPSPDSAYAVKTRRILDLAEELDFPVFLPLNGYQWWDELPELYNYWDSDGTHTDPKFFSRQDNPEDFKKRFIAGYNPQNKWNVEWQDKQTPMKLNYRNWGGGGFRLAPPPNLVENPQTPKSYRSVQRERLQVIVTEIQKKVSEWKSEEKDHLFVGLSIGTEINLNASVTAKDEFKPYGYRAIQDLNSKIQMSNSNENSKANILSDPEARIEVIRKYLEDNAKLITRLGIPKENIYTHVLGEQNPDDAHYGPYAESSFNLYSEPGSSFYGFAHNPLASKQWSTMLSRFGQPNWGALEYTSDISVSGLLQTVSSANITVIYNWDGIPSKSIPALRQVLSKPITHDTCTVNTTILHVQKGLVARLGSDEIKTDSLQSLSHGIYSWFEEKNCSNGKKEYTQPQVISVPVMIPDDTTPKWVQLLLELGF